MTRLVLANLTRRPVRTFLTVAAVVMAVALVVSTTGGYASAERAVRAFIETYLGTSDVAFTTGGAAGTLPGSLVNELRDDPRVSRAFGRIELGRPVPAADGQIAGQINLFGADPRADGYFSRLPLDRGRTFTRADAREAVLDQGAARLLGLDVGDFIEVPGPDGATRLEVVGVVYKPEIFAAFVQTAYVPLATLQKALFPGEGPRVTRVEAEFVPDVDAEAFIDAWRAAGLKQGTPWDVVPVPRQREELDRALRGMNLLSLMGGLVSLLAATFIVFGTLSMGVAERSRNLAVLRAIGMTRRQTASGVVLEGLALAAAGIAVGVPLGLGFVEILVRLFPGVFTAGSALNLAGLGVATAGLGLATLAASLLPAFNASRVDPLAAMRPSADPPRRGFPWPATLAGLVLISVDSLVLWPPIGISPLRESLERDLRFWAHFIVGLPALMFGFFLLAPAVVWTLDKVGSNLIARVLFVEPALLRQTLSGGLWRAAATAAALMVGLAVLVVMNTQGRSSIEGWQLPDTFPDVFVYDMAGFSPEAADALGASPLVARLPDGGPDLSPVAVFNPLLGTSPWQIAGTAFSPERTTFVAVDPGRIFGMMDLQFTAGSRDDAQAMLAGGQTLTLRDGSTRHALPAADGFLSFPGRQPIPAGDVVSAGRGRFLLVTDEFRKLQGASVGDPFTLRKPGAGRLGRLRGVAVEFTIVGVVRSPGIDVMVASFDLGRQFGNQSAASVFGTLDDARDVFGVTRAQLLAANLTTDADKTDVARQLAADVGRRGLAVADVRNLKRQIQDDFDSILKVASTVAWAATAVAGVGVANTVAAGVRARRYGLGILRALGVTRGQLVRLVLAEALLLAAAAVVLGLSAGLLMSVNARELQTWAVGYRPERMRIDWHAAFLGTLAVLAVSLLAALAPAVSTARTAPLRLLQSGRSSD